MVNVIINACAFAMVTCQNVCYEEQPIQVKRVTLFQLNQI